MKNLTKNDYTIVDKYSYILYFCNIYNYMYPASNISNLKNIYIKYIKIEYEKQNI